MDNFGGEIGQKMRSAVKAKLIELGTGAAGYIDDELPDYVMIMVANKRSKQQMITDLHLFLGEQTELFVTWLHEVLQKLQEVTLPTIAVGINKKRKIHTSKEPHTKREKRTGKRDKRSIKPTDVAGISSPEFERPTTTSEESRNVTIPVVNSITDVFAEEFLEKAKKTLEEIPNSKQESKKTKKKINISVIDSRAQTKTTNEFDIPTISEISSTTESIELSKLEGHSNRKKDLAELEEIQRKIYFAKKHLKARGQLPIDEDDLVDNESLDKDCLNLKDDGCGEFSDENVEKINENSSQAMTIPKSPILFDVIVVQNNKKNNSNSLLISNINSGKPITATEQINENTQSNITYGTGLKLSTSYDSDLDIGSQADEIKKRSVHERLGNRQKSERLRQDKELYVPAHRRKDIISSNTETERSRSRLKNSDRSREQLQNRERDRFVNNCNGKRRENTCQQQNITPDRRSLTKFVEHHTPPPKERTITPDLVKVMSPLTETRKRVGSRVIVAPTKVIEPSDDEDLNTKPVNSVIKIKPRQPVSPSKQACKNLLLRAVADAQRSTILAKKPKEKKPATQRLGDIVITKERNAKLYTKSYRNRLKQSGPSEIFRRTTKNLIVEVEPIKDSKQHKADNRSQSKNREVASDKISHTEFVCINLAKNKQEKCDDTSFGNEGYNEYDIDLNEKIDKDNLPDTQFVVTLNDNKSSCNYTKRVLISRSESSSPSEQVTSSSMATQHNTGEPNSTNKSVKLDIQKYNSVKEYSMKNLTRKTRKCESPSSSHNSNTPPIHSSHRSELIEVYRNPKDVNKIIIKADTDDDDEMSPKVIKVENSKSPFNQKDFKKLQKIELKSTQENKEVDGSLTPPLPPKALMRLPSSPALPNPLNNLQKKHHSLQKRKHVPIKYDLDKKVETSKKQGSIELIKKSRCSESNEYNSSSSKANDKNNRLAESYEEHRKINTRTMEDRKYDNIPSLSAVSVDISALKIFKPKERCIYHPNCTKNVCEYYHPSAPCKAFPNCKFGDKCMYTHPKCKYDVACMNTECNFMHSGQRNITTGAPPLSSHVVPVQTYKSISAASAPNTSAVMCKYYPNCTKIGCTFYHPKPCRFGKNCINKLECNFYHHEVQSCNKFKWVAQTG